MAPAPSLASLLRCVRFDDVTGLRRALAARPELARDAVAADAFQAWVPRWLYVGDTALHLAAAALRPACAQALLDAGADARAANRRGATPLHYACDPRPASGGAWDPEAQRQLIATLARSGDVDAGDAGGVTALHRAVRARSLAAVEALLAAGADPGRRSRRGATALDLTGHATGAGGTAGSGAVATAIADALRRAASTRRPSPTPAHRPRRAAAKRGRTAR